MSSLVDARERLAAALEAGGIRVAKTGQMAPPCVLLEPGDPWSEPERMPGRTSRWRLVAIAGVPDTLGAYAELAALADLVDVALRPLAGAQLPTWSRPAEYELAGVRHAATIATIKYASS